ncbi:DUF3852 domain-containing protein [Ruminococcus sp. Marseille-P6503]|uniref:DUF3852 domain-containing protein n=1 Tax=Ruminococcus sp. Marseille-P6503 TaxID=2364796 RepID=UPI000F54968D|nr:DUF3852 domain-containing protein [Ruminococcus sp. Marseille-P6503]
MIKRGISKIFIAAVSAVYVLSAMTITASANGDVAGAVTSTWTSAKSQIKEVVNNVVFPVIDVILAILLFVKIATCYMEYRKHGQFEWTPIAILFGCLIFALTAPLYVWTIVSI